MDLHVVEHDFYEAWYRTLRQLWLHGDKRSPRGIPTREILGVSVKVENGYRNILYHDNRKLNYKFMVAEWLWIMYGVNDLDVIARYNSQLKKFSDDGVVLAGAYGPRLIHQFPWLLDKLAESDTRQAVVTIWTPNPLPSKDIPCTISLQFLRRDDQINLIVSMRSSDIWLGLPYDFFVFSQILNCLCGHLGCSVGFVQFNLGSSHLYESNIEEADGLLNGYTNGTTIVSQRLPGMPPLSLLEWLRDPSDIGQRNVQVSVHWLPYKNVLIHPREDAIKILTA